MICHLFYVLDYEVSSLNSSRVGTLFCGQNLRLIPDFFQITFLFSRLKVTVRFFMAREEITVLTMKTTS